VLGRRSLASSSSSSAWSGWNTAAM
jgi:hypothetical protein